MSLTPSAQEQACNFLKELRGLSAEDQVRILRMVMLFAGAADDVKDCAYVMIRRLIKRVHEGRDVVVQGVEEITTYIETAPSVIKDPDRAVGAGS